MPEPSDVSLRGLAIGAAIIVGGIALSLGAAALITLRVSAPATGPSAGEAPQVEGPALQTAARGDLAAFMREKNRRLGSCGRVDDQHVHIPIERAMRIVAKGREK
ncbi:MAG TPA: hypothetical protein VFR50_00410 [Casimicrobiaceae bacterium]|nr:hypothetical protein [Casimicrobiaceae bacterium]